MTTPHDHHPPPNLTCGHDPHGRPVNAELIDSLLGALLDACRDCQLVALDETQTDPVTTARAVEPPTAISGGYPHP